MKKIHFVSVFCLALFTRSSIAAECLSPEALKMKPAAIVPIEEAALVDVFEHAISQFQKRGQAKKLYLLEDTSKGLKISNGIMRKLEKRLRRNKQKIQISKVERKDTDLHLPDTTSIGFHKICWVVEDRMIVSVRGYGQEWDSEGFTYYVDLRKGKWQIYDVISQGVR